MRFLINKEESRESIYMINMPPHTHTQRSVLSRKHSLLILSINELLLSRSCDKAVPGAERSPDCPWVYPSQPQSCCPFLQEPGFLVSRVPYPAQVALFPSSSLSRVRQRQFSFSFFVFTLCVFHIKYLHPFHFPISSHPPSALATSAPSNKIKIKLKGRRRSASILPGRL